ncbi:hypothetical protein [Mycobacteroides abscessus]|uniref:hypothetical protein n=1 Tax=Mycobacteroides abscessus TaxID=36809 RepID=UPI0012FFDE00|nr:hypothetical protein [Mycobacteroides abscessus]
MSRPEVVGIEVSRPGDTHGMRMSRKTFVTTALVAASVAVSACTSTTPGVPLASDTTTPVSVSTATATSAPRTTSAPDPHAALVKVVNAAMTDVSRFWASEGVVVPIRATIVTDQADGPCSPSRDAEKAAQAVAWACDMTTPQVVVVNPENLSAKVADQFGDIGTYIVIAHEQGHIGMPLLNPATDTDSDVEERRADCASGAYFKWVVAGQSPSVSVTEAQAGGTATAMWRDTPERTKAFADGITYGLPRCLA